MRKLAVLQGAQGWQGWLINRDLGQKGDPIETQIVKIQSHLGVVYLDEDGTAVLQGWQGW